MTKLPFKADQPSKLDTVSQPDMCAGGSEEILTGDALNEAQLGNR
jgi:hypothetical protein